MTNAKSSKLVVTKGDLDRLATKESIKKLASKAELKRVERNLRTEILRVEARVENIEEKVEGLDQKFDKKFDSVMSKLDGIAKGVDDLRTENVVGAHHTRQLRVYQSSMSLQPKI